MNNLKKSISIISLLTIFILTGCNNKNYKNEINNTELCNCNKIDNCECKDLYQTITEEQAKNLIYNGNTFLIDVRSLIEYNNKHIDGAISIPLDEIENIEFAKDINLIVYCQSGNRSKQASQKLLNLGYVNVYDLGSIDNWK